MDLQLIIILIFCGMLTNLMSAIFGIGGGVLMVPILYTLFPDFPLQMVAATSLTIVIGSALINLTYFYKQKIQINIKSMLLWSLGMIIGVQLGFEASFHLHDNIIIGVFVITLSLLALRTIFHKAVVDNTTVTSNDSLKGAILCLFGGSVAGMTGIGGGSIMAPLIGQLRSVKPYQIAPYTNYMMVIGGLGSLYGYLSKTPPFHLDYGWQIGYVNFSVVTLVVLSSFVTSFLSMKIRGILKPDLARKLLGFILLVIAAYMLIVHLGK
ncbi:sulfite exporter TauE/SafE family protein [Pasteurella oralis]|uniref:sulfite exporter TauE/SafE family protein n=1 Tax=Pasteurella oralis TaxID=1071947 RepID=UPI000C7B190A|nr:sulfite exporter TauE/SafE family protein [Pasteurella oralis]